MTLTSSGKTILAIDDDMATLKVLSTSLQMHGYEVIATGDCREALELVEQQRYDLIISDLCMPEMDGISLMERIRSRGIISPFIIITACGSIESAVEAMRKGANDYIEKPFKLGELLVKVRKSIDYHKLLSDTMKVKAYFEEKFSLGNFFTTSAAMSNTLMMAEKVASSPMTTVAIYGESGTGKEVLARSIHFATTGLPTNFVAVNCAAIPENLMESELFGHTKGAFTGADRDREGKFQQAHGGTLLLDEVGDLPLPLQAKLLRVLEERSFQRVGDNLTISLDCRVIVATNVNLAKRVEQGTFREDLYHRINVFPLHIPPLRERAEDINELALVILDELRQHLGKPLTGISPEAMEAIARHDWPGNVRELRNRLERAAILTTDTTIHPEHLGIQETSTSTTAPAPPYQSCATYHLSLPHESLSLSKLTHLILAETLTRCNGNKSKAADMLKIDRKMFYRS